MNLSKALNTMQELLLAMEKVDSTEPVGSRMGADKLAAQWIVPLLYHRCDGVGDLAKHILAKHFCMRTVMQHYAYT